MRVGLSFCCGVVGLVTAGQATAWDNRPLNPPGPTFISELRVGAFAHDPWGPERHSGNVSGEIVLRRPFTPGDLFTSYFVPRPHVGGSLNVSGKTSFSYTGLTWTADLTPRLFVEGSIGGALHTGHTSDALAPRGRAALGCSPLFRETGSVGVRLSTNWSVMATVEHLTNHGLCNENRGLTNIGARLGYSF